MAHRDGAELDDPGWGEGSRFAAHLDRGWWLLDRGDVAAARTSAEEARQIRPDDPDAAVLLGAIALAEHKADESIRWYERAVELDPDYLEPYAAAAQVCLFDLDDPARALRYCNEAIELENLHPFERLDLQLLAAESELALGEDAGAVERLSNLPEIQVLRAALALEPPAEGQTTEAGADPIRAEATAFLYHDPDGGLLDDEDIAQQIQRVLHFALRLGRVWLDLGENDKVVELLREIVDRFPHDPDAWHMLGEAELAGGDIAMATQAAMRTLRLDAQTSPPVWTPSPALLHAKVLDVLRSAGDSTISDLLEQPVGLNVVVDDGPPAELVLEGIDPRVPVLALVSRGPGQDGGGEAVLTGLAVYRRNVVRLARIPEQLDEEVRQAVLEELAMFFHLDDERRAALDLVPVGGGAAESEAEGERRRRRK